MLRPSSPALPPQPRQLTPIPACYQRPRRIKCLSHRPIATGRGDLSAEPMSGWPPKASIRVRCSGASLAATVALPTGRLVPSLEWESRGRRISATRMVAMCLSALCISGRWPAAPTPDHLAQAFAAGASFAGRTAPPAASSDATSTPGSTANIGTMSNATAPGDHAGRREGATSYCALAVAQLMMGAETTKDR